MTNTIDGYIYSCCFSCFASSSSSSVYGDLDGLEDVELPNTALLVGPTGVGKTASVYALAHEMGFKVLEVNASATRNGRQVLANLREATQSHHVRKAGKNRHVLILFEDIDQYFGEADEGFYSAVNNLIASTKRPILLTTSNPAFLPMQMGSGKSKVLKNLPQAFHYRPVDPEAAARHLQLLGLVEGFPIDIASLTNLCTIYHGNISKSLLALQWWTLRLSKAAASEATEAIVVPATASGSVEKTGSDSMGSSGDVCSVVKMKAALEAVEAEEAEEATIVTLMSIGKKSSKAKVLSEEYQMSDYYSLNTDLLLEAASKENGGQTSNKAGTSQIASAAASASSASIFEWHHYNMLLPLANLRPSSSANEPPFEPRVNTASVTASTMWRPEHLHLDKNVFAADSSDEEENDDKETVDEKAASTAASTEAVVGEALIETANSRTTAVAKPSSSLQPPKDGETSANQDCHQDSLGGLHNLKNRKKAMNFLCRSMDTASHFMCMASHDKGETWTDEAATQIMELTVASASASMTVAAAAASDLHASSDSEEGSKKNTKDLIMDVYQSRDVLAASRGRALHCAHEQVLQTATSSLFNDRLTVNNRMAFMDILPSIRSMARSEAARKQTNCEVKRSRSGRFIHYFDTVQIDLTEESLRTLQDPIPFLSYTTSDYE